jgi:hypothetical protein
MICQPSVEVLGQRTLPGGLVGPPLPPQECGPEYEPGEACPPAPAPSAGPVVNEAWFEAYLPSQSS